MTLMFCATRNLYDKIPATLESLFQTNKDVERVYLFIEDDEFPFDLDPRVEVVNLNRMTQYLLPSSPNFNTVFTKMSFVRCYVSKYLLEDKILYADVDVLFLRDISDLWNIDFEDNLVCAVAETPERIRCVPHITNEFASPYFNSGVTLLNLRVLREEARDDEIIKIINIEIGVSY